VAGVSLLERVAQLLRLPTLLVELGFKLSELHQLCLLLRHVCRGEWPRRCSWTRRGHRGVGCVSRDVVVIAGLSYHNDEALPSWIVVPLAGVVGTGKAVFSRNLKLQESFEITDPGVIPLRVHATSHGDRLLVRGVRV
jgi:hypothetical protein